MTGGASGCERCRWAPEALDLAGACLATSTRPRRTRRRTRVPSDLRGGRYVAFSSGASNLVRADTSTVEDVFVRVIAT